MSTSGRAFGVDERPSACDFHAELSAEASPST